MASSVVSLTLSAVAMLIKAKYSDLVSP